MTYPSPGPNVPYVHSANPGFGPTPGYGPGYGAGFDPRMARAAQLAESARNWLIVCAIGWFVGFMWITGPLAWYQSSQFARDFETMGMAPPSEVTNLRLLGIITTIFVGVGVVVGVAVVAMVVIGFVAFAPR